MFHVILSSFYLVLLLSIIFLDNCYFSNPDTSSRLQPSLFMAPPLTTMILSNSLNEILHISHLGGFNSILVFTPFPRLKSCLHDHLDIFLYSLDRTVKGIVGLDLLTWSLF